MKINPLDTFNLRAMWSCLPAEIQEEIGSAAIDMVFSGFVSGEAYAHEDRPCTEEIRGAAYLRSDEALNKLNTTIENALPQLFGASGEWPTWAWWEAPTTRSKPDRDPS